MYQKQSRTEKFLFEPQTHPGPSVQKIWNLCVCGGNKNFPHLILLELIWYLIFHLLFHHLLYRMYLKILDMLQLFRTFRFHKRCHTSNETFFEISSVFNLFSTILPQCSIYYGISSRLLVLLNFNFSDQNSKIDDESRTHIHQESATLPWYCGIIWSIILFIAIIGVIFVERSLSKNCIYPPSTYFGYSLRQSICISDHLHPFDGNGCACMTMHGTIQEPFVEEFKNLSFENMELLFILFNETWYNQWNMVQSSIDIWKCDDSTRSNE